MWVVIGDRRTLLTGDSPMFHFFLINLAPLGVLPEEVRARSSDKSLKHGSASSIWKVRIKMSGLGESAAAAESEFRQLVTFRVQSQYYAVPIESVVEMTLQTHIDPIVGSPVWVRGIMQLRDRVLPILDLRSRLGITDMSEEVDVLEAELLQHKQDHIRWLKTLEESCATGSRFELERDPTQCAFGLWFFSFKTEDAILSNQIAKFEGPHNRIHTLADRCLGMAANGQQDAAQKEVDAGREVDLGDMIRITDATVSEMRERSHQMVVILRGEKENLGLAVDKVESVTTVDSEHVEPRPLQDLDSSGSVPAPDEELLVTSVVRSENNGGLIQVLDVEKLFASAGVGYSDSAPDESSQISMDASHT
ncbi:MAG: hypothetical protein GY937_16900 [bacterium]|nr:hypothetical protein [bacterium]